MIRFIATEALFLLIAVSKPTIAQSRFHAGDTDMWIGYGWSAASGNTIQSGMRLLYAPTHRLNFGFQVGESTTFRVVDDQLLSGSAVSWSSSRLTMGEEYWSAGISAEWAVAHQGDGARYDLMVRLIKSLPIEAVQRDTRSDAYGTALRAALGGRSEWQYLMVSVENVWKARDGYVVPAVHHIHAFGKDRAIVMELSLGYILPMSVSVVGFGVGFVF